MVKKIDYIQFENEVKKAGYRIRLETKHMSFVVKDDIDIMPFAIDHHKKSKDQVKMSYVFRFRKLVKEMEA